MRIMEPVLPREMETAIPLEEALAMAAAYEEPVYGYAFAGGSAASASATTCAAMGMSSPFRPSG